MHKCIICGYLYNPEEGDPIGGIVPGTAFEDIAPEWLCPLCSASKEEFEEVDF